MSDILKFPEICVTEASAGSGKTYALAKRYLQLLLLTARDNPQQYKNILAITFTNKASVEMKGRVFLFLKKTALKQLSAAEEKDFLLPLSLSAQQASSIAYPLMESMIRHYHFVAVKTIDSFINTLLAGCSFKINLSSRFRIQRNSQEYIQQSLDKWIMTARQDASVRVLLNDFVHQYLFLENRSGWFPKEDLLKVINGLFAEFNTYQRSFLTFPVESGAIYADKKDFLEYARHVAIHADGLVNKTFLNGLNRFITEHPVAFDLDQVSRRFAHPEPPLNKGCTATDELMSWWSKAHRSIERLCRAESYGVFNPYVLIFQEVMDVLGDRCVQEDILFLEELNKKAALLTQDGITASELYYRLSARFHHYLIDEFQDTSVSQWQNLSLMVQEALSSGGSLYLVGDRKQAIYAFRGGESRLFDELPRQLPYAPIRREYLTKNWRSRRAIVEFNNRIFSTANLRGFIARRHAFLLEKKEEDDVFFSENDIDGLEGIFAHAQQDIRSDMPNGFVQISHISGKKKEDREPLIRQKLLETLSELSHRFALRQIAVLTRNNAQVEEVTQWLLSAGFHVQSERSSDIKNHPLILEILDFLRFLHEPNKDVHFARFLLGEIFPKASGISSVELQQFLFESAQDKARSKEMSLYRLFSLKYPDVCRDLLDVFLAQQEMRPVYESLVGIYESFSLKAFSEAQGFVMHLLELAKRREEFSCSTGDFIVYMDALDNEERFVPVPAQDAVKVMTVHKSKGLQFEAVIIPYLEMSAQSSKGGQGGLSYVLDLSDEGLRMLRLKKTYAAFSPVLRKRYEDEYKKALMTEINTVYVALTRAISELYVMIPDRVANSVNPAIFLFPEDIVTAGIRRPALLPEALSELPVLDADMSRRWVSSLRQEIDLEGEDKLKLRQQGVILHYCLALLGHLGKDISEDIERVITEACRHFGVIVDKAFYGKMLTDFLLRADVKRFFYFDEDVAVLCEQEIVNRFGDIRRLDRLIVFKDRVWVVDFKTSRIGQDDHERQIREYVDLLKELYPSFAVEGFLVYL